MYLAIFFEMHYLYIIWLYAFQIIRCKIVFVYLVLLLLHRIGNLLAYVAALLVASFWGLIASVAEWLVRETQICSFEETQFAARLQI